MNRFHKMDRFFKSCLLASAGLVMLAVTLSFIASGRAFAQRVEWHTQPEVRRNPQGCDGEDRTFMRALRREARRRGPYEVLREEPQA